jgi:hypothetical protein
MFLFQTFFIKYLVAPICPQHKLNYIESKDICRDPAMVRKQSRFVVFESDY